MNNTNDLYFSTAALLLKVFLFQKDSKISFGETNFNEEGFSIDYSSKSLNLSSNEFKSIQKHLIKLALNTGDAVVKKVNKKEAIKLLEQDKYQLSLINEMNHVNFTFVNFPKLNNHWFWYETPFADKLKNLKAVHLFSISGVYWQGNEKNEQLVRITGCGFNQVDELEKHIKLIELRKESDHRKIGKNLELFTFDKLSGQGMPIFLPKGTTLKKLIGDYVHECQDKYGFTFVSTPILGNLDLYKLSGHYSHYNEDMFPPMKLSDDESMMLRPMTCPHHCLIYLYKPRSYRELPLRLSEDSILHRFESSGGLTGLERVRAMTLLDNHIFCRPDQIESEITNAYNIINEVTKNFNLKFEQVDFAVHDPNDKKKFIDNDLMWKSSEQQLEKALKKLKIKYSKKVGDAAFYGPKIDFQCRTVLNKIITCSTIQLDFSLPEKFNLKFINEKQKEINTVIIHLGIIGTYERFIAMLLEQNKGILPVWLSPVQVQIIPVNIDLHISASQKLYQLLKDEKIRCEIDQRDERISKRIRDAQINKIPFQIVIGDNEQASDLKNINYRKYGDEKIYSSKLKEFIDMIKNANEKHI